MGEHTCEGYPDKDSPASAFWVESEHDLSPVNERKLLHTARTLKSQRSRVIRTVGKSQPT